MNNFHRLGPTSLTELLAPSIKDDPTIVATSSVLDNLLANATRSIPNLLLWARLTPNSAYLSTPMQRLAQFAGGLKALSEEELELLAWQEHVDFWRPEWSRPVREDLVRNSTAWHRIKGTPASLKAALALFGHDVKVEEDGKGKHWATYQLGLDEIANLETVLQIWEIAMEMQPARCKLWRMYTNEFDMRPTVWSEKPSWSNGYYSYHSGVLVPEIAPGLIVSFGSRLALTSEPYNPDCAFGLSSTLGLLCPYLDRPIWGRSKWGDVFPQNHGFAVSELISFHFAVPQIVTWEWEGEWDGRPWGQILDWDRPLPQWYMRHRAVSRSQASWGEEVKPWGDINSRYGASSATIVDNPPRWGDSTWSHKSERKTLVLHEMSTAKLTLQGQALIPEAAEAPDVPAGVIANLTAIATPPLRDLSWTGEWDKRRWYDYSVFSCITSHRREQDEL